MKSFRPGPTSRLKQKKKSFKKITKSVPVHLKLMIMNNINYILNIGPQRSHTAD